ncbi:MAG: type II toxin-antitoxin system HicB family antitoxin [Defluviitaleaceae bacterium]|nr:type II toxin-antitoxin system HicB family antitoxin [Defluviitaleaceae bacterium]
MKLKNNYLYPAVLTYEDGYDIAVTFPDLPGCTTCVKTEEEALQMAKEALGSHLWCLEKDSDEIPPATNLKDVKLDENEQAILVDVYMPTIRLANENRSVNRTVTLPAWLNAAALEKGINFSQTLQSTLMRELGLVQSNINNMDIQV